jgi:hypothetical protein
VNPDRGAAALAAGLVDLAVDAGNEILASDRILEEFR